MPRLAEQNPKLVSANFGMIKDLIKHCRTPAEAFDVLCHLPGMTTAQLSDFDKLVDPYEAHRL